MMNIYFRLIFVLFCVSFNVFRSKAQCNVKSQMHANGTMSRVTDSELIYSNEKYRMFSQMQFDGKDYFFIWVVKPLTIDSSKSKYMAITLTDKAVIKLDFYDVYPQSKDTSINVLFLMTPEQVLQLSKQTIESIQLETDTGQRHFILKDHKEAVKNQLNCLLKEDK